MAFHYDVIVIGGGVVGSAVARELARYQLRSAVLEKELDVCCETSARNSGVLHAGYNNKPGSKMARFCVEGNLGFDEVAEELAVPFKRTGKLVVGFTDDDMERLLALKRQGEANGVPGLEIIDGARIREIAPQVGGEFAMWCPTTGILDPFQLTIALAENAAENGVTYHFGSPVTGISRAPDGYTVTTPQGSYESRWIINCAGLNADKISALMGIEGYTIHPCRGEYFILDQQVGELLPVPAYPVPNPKEGGLGIHLTPSVDGNVFVGPSATYLDENDDYAVTQDVMDMLIADGSRIFPHLKKEFFIRNFAGIRPKLTSKEQGGYEDFVIERRDDLAPHTINLVGIESPGLTAALPIAREVVRLMQEVEPLTVNPNFSPRRESQQPFRELDHAEQARLIAENADYGEIICRCETITKAEVLAAIRNPLGVTTMTGIKYRCRAMMGRCQGGYCQTRISELIMQEKNLTRPELRYNRPGSYLFTGEVREA